MNTAEQEIEQLAQQAWIELWAGTELLPGHTETEWIFFLEGFKRCARKKEELKQKPSNFQSVIDKGAAQGKGWWSSIADEYL